MPPGWNILAELNDSDLVNNDLIDFDWSSLLINFNLITLIILNLQLS